MNVIYEMTEQERVAVRRRSDELLRLLGTIMELRGLDPRAVVNPSLTAFVLPVEADGETAQGGDTQ